MPFKEHRGAGKQGVKVDSMLSRWGAEWCACAGSDVAYLACRETRGEKVRG